jgi:hypothetical protein
MICASTNVYKRVWDDQKALGQGKHFNAAVQADLDADGPQAFEFWLVQKVGVPELLKLLKEYHVREAVKNGISYNVKAAVQKAPRGSQRIEHSPP